MRTTNTYWPDNDQANLYISADFTLSVKELIEKCKEHFGEDVDLDSLEIEAVYEHTDCVGYDLYDADDYTNFIHIYVK